MIWLDSNFARVFLNQDVEVSSPQPQPIDDIAGVRAAPWDNSAPRAVQVVFRRGVLDLMPLLCRNRQERRCNPPFSPRLIQITTRRWGLHERQSHGADMLAITRLSTLASEFREVAPRVELGRSPEPPISRVVLLRKERKPSSRATHQCRIPVEIGFEPNALELTPFACL
jgi:hypothetical protein